MLLYKKITNKLIKNKITVSTAESCTGGILANSFIKYKNASKIFKTGYITYSNKSKIDNFKINKNILNKYGAVSYQVAKIMVENFYKKEKCILSISTTGIAGPNGATTLKPVGLVYIGIKYKLKIIIYKKIFKGSRIQIQKKTVRFIFNKISKLI